VTNWSHELTSSSQRVKRGIPLTASHSHRPSEVYGCTEADAELKASVDNLRVACLANGDVLA
jgi:hypothetical protein